ncbi:unnamed protein product [Amoebophrya sp. A25]|nr:unnamed protein product [Amoebophrya sp. A25]|eukprot:GSA25T00019451001.1
MLVSSPAAVSSRRCRYRLPPPAPRTDDAKQEDPEDAKNAAQEGSHPQEPALHPLDDLLFVASPGSGAPAKTAKSNALPKRLGEYLKDQTYEHNPTRLGMLVAARPVDHRGHVQMEVIKNFDLNRTIFEPVTGGTVRAALTAALAVEPNWREGRVKEIKKRVEEAPMIIGFTARDLLTYGNWTPILDFMNTHCNFNTEHADGSFMDHLHFCRDYCVAHYHQESPRVLFLHSIMGVTTGFFPMGADKIPMLEKLVTADEFQQISSFPSILRFLKGTRIVEELWEFFVVPRSTSTTSTSTTTTSATPAKRTTPSGIRFKRVLDKAEIQLTMGELWKHLNFHLIHALDFLPVAGWKANWSRPFIHDFLELYVLLKCANQLQCRVAVPNGVLLKTAEEILKQGGSDITHPQSGYCLNPAFDSGYFGGLEGQPFTFWNVVLRTAPLSFWAKKQREQIAQFSKSTNFELKYEWVFDADAEEEQAGTSKP